MKCKNCGGVPYKNQLKNKNTKADFEENKTRTGSTLFFCFCDGDVDRKGNLKKGIIWN